MAIKKHAPQAQMAIAWAQEPPALGGENHRAPMYSVRPSSRSPVSTHCDTSGSCALSPGVLEGQGAEQTSLI